MKTTMTWAGLALGLIMIFGLSSCELIEAILNEGNPSYNLAQDSTYYSEVGIRAEFERARCRKICMDVQSDTLPLVILPTGDSISAPLDSAGFSNCVLLCNRNSELSPEFIAMDRSHIRTFRILGQLYIAPLSSKMMILSNLPMIMLFGAGPVTIPIPTFPPIGDDDCEMTTCYGHVHLVRSGYVDEDTFPDIDDVLRIIIPVKTADMEVSVGIEEENGTPIQELTVLSDIYEGDVGGYKMATTHWDNLNSYYEVSLKLRVTRSTGTKRNISRTPIWLHSGPLYIE